MNLNVLHKAAMAVGAVAGYYTAKDIAANGYDRGIKNAKVAQANALADMYISHSSSSKYSHTLEGAKKWYQKQVLSQSVFDNLNTVWGIVKSTVGEVINHALPIILILGTFFAPKLATKLLPKIANAIKGSTIAKTILPKTSAIYTKVSTAGVPFSAKFANKQAIAQAAAQTTLKYENIGKRISAGCAGLLATGAAMLGLDNVVGIGNDGLD